MSAAPSRSCPQCGAPVPAGAAEGLCPRCLLALNLATQTRLAGETQPPAGNPAVPPLPMEDVAKLFPQLEIIRLVGTGGMGAVYQARQPALDRFVALKLLHTPPANDPGFAERFAQEARALAKLNHPNIVALHEFGQAGGRPYFLMEFVDGVNLRQLQQAERLSPREALSIVPQVCDALQYAHDEGIVHRDIKPENVLIDRKGRVKVADFGLAKLMGVETATTRLTGVGHVMGTPHYMAPEQVEHPLDVDHRADIFSLGVVFYELLTGELPLGKFPLPSKKVQIDVRLDEVVLRALEKEPSLRYGQASELKTQVETIAGESHSAQASLASPRASQKRPWEITTYIAAVLCCVALLMGLLLHSAGGMWVVVIGATGLAASLIKLKLRHAWPFEVRVETIANRSSAGESFLSGKEVQAPARGLAYVALGCLVVGLVCTPVFFALPNHRGEGPGLVFAAMTGLLALVFGALARRERLGCVVLWVTASILVIMVALGGVLALVRNAQFRAVTEERQRQFDGWPPNPRLEVQVGGSSSERPRFHVQWPASSWRMKDFAGVETKDRFFLRINGTEYPLRTPHEPYAVHRFDFDPLAEGVPVVWSPGKYRAVYVVRGSDYLSPIFPQSMKHPGESASNEVEFEIPAATRTDAATPLHIEFDRDGDTMQGIVDRFRRQYGVRLCFENLDFDAKKDAITLGQVLRQFGERERQGTITAREKESLAAARRLKADEKMADDTLFGVGACYEGRLTAETVEDFLDQLTRGTPYDWRKLGGTWVVIPRAGSRLMFPVTLRTSGLTVEDTVEKILEQRPAGSEIHAGMVVAMPVPTAPGADARPWLRSRLPELELKAVSALEALCRVTEAGRPDAVWELAGYKESRMLGLVAGPNKTAVVPAASPVFGPVVDLAVGGAVDLDTGRVAPMDEHTGQFAELPDSVEKTDDLAGSIVGIVRWLEDERMDMLVATPGELAGLDMRMLAQDQNQWSRLTAAQVMAMLDANTTKAAHYSTLKATENATYVFQTREGDRGVLQILGWASDGKQVKLRYKRVRTGSSAPDAVQAWLSLMDNGRYAESWDAAAESFRDAVTKVDWAAESEKIRRPLGDVISRGGGMTQQVASFPGMPDGAYWIAEFDTAFAGLKLATEVVTFAREKDGQWRVIGYRIRPRTETERAVIVAARAWLEEIDVGDYGASWRDSSGYFRAALTREKWVAALEKVRRPLGARVFRTADACTTTTTLPGVPAGQYVMMQFNASFTADKSAVETVTFMQEKDGTWRAAGYFIK